MYLRWLYLVIITSFAAAFGCLVVVKLSHYEMIDPSHQRIFRILSYAFLGCNPVTTVYFDFAAMVVFCLGRPKIAQRVAASTPSLKHKPSQKNTQQRAKIFLIPPEFLRGKAACWLVRNFQHFALWFTHHFVSVNLYIISTSCCRLCLIIWKTEERSYKGGQRSRLYWAC